MLEKQTETYAESTILKTVLQQIESHPFHEFSGYKIVKMEENHAVCRFPVDANTSNAAGMLHGGILYGLMDVTCACALFPLLKQGEFPVSHNVHFSIIRPSPRGTDIAIHANVVRKGKNIAFLECKAYRVADGEEDILIATGSVTKSILKPGGQD
jgi:uncharacterized protein (TIGR00369 family)